MTFKSHVSYRVRRVKLKFAADQTARRWKKLGPYPPDDWEWEIKILDALEKTCYAKLAELGVDPALWEFYVAYAKRLWVRALKFTGETYLNEKAALIDEFKLRDLTESVLYELEPAAEEWALAKKTGICPIIPEEGILLYGLIPSEYGFNIDDFPTTEEAINIDHRPETEPGLIIDTFPTSEPGLNIEEGQIYIPMGYLVEAGLNLYGKIFPEPNPILYGKALPEIGLNIAKGTVT